MRDEPRAHLIQGSRGGSDCVLSGKMNLCVCHRLFSVEMERASERNEQSRAKERKRKRGKMVLAEFSEKEIERKRCLQAVNSTKRVLTMGYRSSVRVDSSIHTFETMFALSRENSLK